MKANDFIDLVKNMRLAQKKYFKQRGTPNMVASIELERQVDQALAEGIDLTGATQQLDLFATANAEPSEKSGGGSSEKAEATDGHAIRSI
jgi:hypothetical protein